MKLLVFLAFAGMAVLAVPVIAGAQPREQPKDDVKKTTVSCPKAMEPKPQNQLDFSGNTNGLQFDPFAPGGARPAATPGSQHAGVDPTTVTLFPSTEPSTEASTTGKTENHAENPCP